MKRVIAVYDVDPFYAERLAAVANQKETVPFTVIAFTTLERLRMYLEENPVEILLVDASAREQVRDLPVKQILSLSDGELVPVEEGYSSIYKYQSADGILREVMASYNVAPAVGLAPVGSPSTLIGVYSPVNRCCKTSFSLALGQVMSKDRKVLYLNFEDCSALRKLLPEPVQGDLSDALYYYQQGTCNSVKLASLVYTWGGLDYIAPARYPEDLGRLGPEQTAEFLELLAMEGVYDAIIADLGQCGRQAAEILEACHVVYMPVREDCISAAKVEVFEEYLRESGRRDLREKIQKLKLPSLTYLTARENYLDQVVWGEMGNYVRRLLGRFE